MRNNRLQKVVFADFYHNKNNVCKIKKMLYNRNYIDVKEEGKYER